MIALDLHYLADGLAEIEAAIAAGEWLVASDLAHFLDQQTGGGFGWRRMTEARMREGAD